MSEEGKGRLEAKRAATSTNLDDEKTERFERDAVEGSGSTDAVVGADEPPGTLAMRLRDITEEARKRAELERKAREEAEKRRAKEIIASLEEQALAQAKEGKTHLVVMDATYEEFPTFIGLEGWTLNPQHLTGASKIVWEYCDSEGLDPALVSHWSSVKENIHRIDFKIMIRW